jgi:uncharacterized protein
MLDLKRLPTERAAAKDKLASDTAAVAAAKEKVQHNEVAIKALELQIKTRQETIVRLKTQQFETRKNDEFNALKSEVERYTADVTKLEDDEIVLMEKAEELKAAHAACVAALARTQERVDEELRTIAEREKHVSEQLAGTKAERAEASAKVDIDLLAKYDRLFQNKGDSAVAELQSGVCGGCHMKVTAGVVMTAKADRELVSCTNCGRFLYIAHWD